MPAKEMVCTSDVFDGVRYLTKAGRERLQTMPDGYCNMLTDNEAADVLGDGWTVDVIAHIKLYEEMTKLKKTAILDDDGKIIGYEAKAKNI